MKNEMQHTPGPWKLSDKVTARIIPGDGNEGFTIALCSGFNEQEAKANAAYIVHCCNLHQELVQALERFCNVFGNYPAETSAGICVAKARAVLAKAKGE